MSTIDSSLDSSVIAHSPDSTASPDHTDAMALEPSSNINTDHVSPSSPSFPSSSSATTTTSTRQQQQYTGPTPQLSPRTPTTATTAATSVTSHRQHHAGGGGDGTMMVLHPNLPPQPSSTGEGGTSPEQTAQARAALVGTISNLLDVELQGRASVLHANARALEGQERDVVKATESLRKETDKLVKVVKEGSKKVLETGNVQNWAEVLERDFLVLEDTLRQVRRGSDAGGGCSDPDCSGCSYGSRSSSWSGSRTPSRRGSLGDDGGDQNGAVVPDEGKGKGKAVDESAVTRGAAAAADWTGMDIDASENDSNAFAQVNSAIAASISEAMASSIDDFFVAPTPPPATSTEDVSSPRPAASSASVTMTATTAADPEPRDVSASAGAVGGRSPWEPPSSRMDMDVGDGGDEQKAATIEVHASLDDREIEALKAVGFSPQVVEDTGVGKEDQHGDSDETDVVMSAGRQPNDIEFHQMNKNEDAMHVDIPEGDHHT